MRFAILALFGLALGVGSASATTITYDTLASQLCVGAVGCGTNSQTISGVTFTFTGVGSTSVNVPPTPNFAVLGEFSVSCSNGTGPCSVDLTGQNLNLYIWVNQTSPTSGNAIVVSGTFTGVVSNVDSTATLTFAANSAINIGPISYDLSTGETGNPYALPVAATNPIGTAGNGPFSIYAQVTETVPEPGSVLLSVAGLALLAARLKAKR